MTLPLASKTVQSHDTRVFRFSLPSEKHVLGLPVGQHFFVKATVNGKAVIRAYTPVRDGEGWVDLLIKVYFANVHPRFPAGGLLTQHIDGLAIGDTIEVKGPIGEFAFNVERRRSRPTRTRCSSSPTSTRRRCRRSPRSGSSPAARGSRR